MEGVQSVGGILLPVDSVLLLTGLCVHDFQEVAVVVFLLVGCTDYFGIS